MQGPVIRVQTVREVAEPGGGKRVRLNVFRSHFLLTGGSVGFNDV